HYLIGFAYLCILGFHLYAFMYIFAHFRCFKEFKLLKIVLLVLGVISLFAQGGEKVMVDEIAREYRYGFGINELYILNSFLIINMIFSISIFVLLLKTFKLIELDETKVKSIDEKIFVIAQCMGIIAGFMGLFFTFHFIIIVGRSFPVDKGWVLIPFYLLFLIPYALAVIYWLGLKRKQRIKDWYDEKQIQDMLKSSLLTLLLSIPGLAVFLLFKVSIPYFWFAYYFFMILLLFSSATLYFFKIRDID
ncbi:MAG: hypothetical protein P8078_12750, partial [bacterium]